jgi:hypothetical protein
MFILGSYRTKLARTSNEELQLSINVNEHTLQGHYKEAESRCAMCMPRLSFDKRLLYDR